MVCVLPSLSVQYALETVVVLCWLGLPCPILCCFVQSGSVCVSPVCVVSLLCLLFLSFSFPRLSCGYSVCSVFSLFLHPSKASRVQVFSHAKANKAQKLTIESFNTAPAPVLSKEHTDRTREPQVCSVMTPAKLSSDDPILRSSATPVSYSPRKLERRNAASDSQKNTANNDVFWSAAKTCSLWWKMTFASVNVSHFCLTSPHGSLSHISRTCRNMCSRVSARKSLSSYVWLTKNSQKLAEPPRLLRSSVAR